MIGDRIVCGIQDENTQQRLLSESKMTFKKSFKIVQGIEATHWYVLDLGSQNQITRGKEEVWYTNKRGQDNNKN